MTKFQIAIFFYGLFLLALGIEAFMRVHEVASLLGGGGIGILEIMLAVYTYKNPRVGFIGAAVLGLLTAGMFISQIFGKRGFTWYPGALVITVSLLFVYFLVSGHFAARKARKASAQKAG